MRVVAVAAVEMALIALAVAFVQRWRLPQQPRLVGTGRTRRRRAPHVELRIEIALAAGGAVALALVGGASILLAMRLLDWYVNR